MRPILRIISSKDQPNNMALQFYQKTNDIVLTMLQQMETSDISNDKEVVGSIRSLNSDKKLSEEQLLHIQKELW